MSSTNITVMEGPPLFWLKNRLGLALRNALQSLEILYNIRLDSHSSGDYENLSYPQQGAFIQKTVNMYRKHRAEVCVCFDKPVWPRRAVGVLC